MKDSFQQYTAKLGHSEEQDVLHLSLWGSWDSQGHKDAEDAARKNDNVYSVFQPEVAIDTIKDTYKRREAVNIVQKIQPEQNVLIS